MKFWGIVLENSVTCFAIRDRVNLLEIKSSFIYLHIFCNEFRLIPVPLQQNLLLLIPPTNHSQIQGKSIYIKGNLLALLLLSTKCSGKTVSSRNADGLVTLLHTVRFPQHFHIWEGSLTHTKSQLNNRRQPLALYIHLPGQGIRGIRGLRDLTSCYMWDRENEYKCEIHFSFHEFPAITNPRRGDRQETTSQPTLRFHQAQLTPPLLATYLLYHHIQPGTLVCKIAESYPQDESKTAGLWNLESVFHVLSFLHLSSPNNS